jgi:hypothetical protein
MRRFGWLVFSAIAAGSFGLCLILIFQYVQAEEAHSGPIVRAYHQSRAGRGEWAEARVVSLAEIIVASLTPLVWLTVRLFVKPKPLAGTCLSCGYNLTGNISGVCPECGTPTT